MPLIMLNKELDDYLDFVRRFMKEQAMNASGPLLMGGSGYEETSLKLLEQFNDYEK
jgi:hypothetical protein